MQRQTGQLHGTGGFIMSDLYCTLALTACHKFYTACHLAPYNMPPRALSTCTNLTVYPNEHFWNVTRTLFLLLAAQGAVWLVFRAWERHLFRRGCGCV